MVLLMVMIERKHSSPLWESRGRSSLGGVITGFVVLFFKVEMPFGGNFMTYTQDFIGKMYWSEIKKILKKVNLFG